jgi:hypothetical protein
MNKGFLAALVSLLAGCGASAPGPTCATDLDCRESARCLDGHCGRLDDVDARADPDAAVETPDAWVYVPITRTETAECARYDLDYGGSAGIATRWYARSSTTFDPATVRSVTVRLTDVEVFGATYSLRCGEGICPPDGAPPLIPSARIEATGTMDADGRLFVDCGESSQRGEPLRPEAGYRYRRVTFEVTE